MTEIDRSGTFENLDHSRRAPIGVRRFLLAVVDFNAEDNTNREEFVEFFITGASADTSDAIVANLGNAAPGLGVIAMERESEGRPGSHQCGDDVFENRYVEEVDRAIEQWEPTNTLLGKQVMVSYGEMVARRKARCSTAR